MSIWNLNCPGSRRSRRGPGCRRCRPCCPRTRHRGGEGGAEPEVLVERIQGAGLLGGGDDHRGWARHVSGVRREARGVTAPGPSTTSIVGPGCCRPPAGPRSCLRCRPCRGPGPLRRGLEVQHQRGRRPGGLGRRLVVPSPPRPQPARSSSRATPGAATCASRSCQVCSDLGLRTNWVARCHQAQSYGGPSPGPRFDNPTDAGYAVLSNPQVG